MKKRFVVTWLVLLTVSLVFLTSIPVHAQEKVMKLRLSAIWPPQHPFSQMLVSGERTLRRQLREG